jgi:hypothetical protein
MLTVTYAECRFAECRGACAPIKAHLLVSPILH